MFYITLEHIMYFSYGIKVTHLNTSENFEEKKYQHPVDELGWTNQVLTTSTTNEKLANKTSKKHHSK